MAGGGFGRCGVVSDVWGKCADKKLLLVVYFLIIFE